MFSFELVKFAYFYMLIEGYSVEETIEDLEETIYDPDMKRSFVSYVYKADLLKDLLEKYRNV